MKNNLENNIKESLKNFEVAYNPKAWTSMNAKLNAKTPVGGSSSIFKWIVAASTIIAVTVTTYYITKDNNSQKTTIQVAETKLKTNTHEQTPLVKKNESTETQFQEIELKKSTNNSNFTKEESTDEKNIFTETENSTSTEDTKVNISQSIEDNTQNERKIDKNTETALKLPRSAVQLPQLNAICLNESFTIENTNDIAIIVYGPQFSKIIPAHSSQTLQAKFDGRYIIATEEITDIPSTTFDVKPLPKVDFRIDTENKFKKGLPTTTLHSIEGIDLTWKINGFVHKGNQVDAHFYSKGIQTIELTSTGINGCENSMKKEFFHDEKYNLMAVNSFIPNHNDPRLNTFMPFALTERNVNFNLIIIDPIDGHILYQTNDSSRGWDGTDSKTGQQVSYENTYIWKVNLLNPEKGESSEYAGNIIPITK